MISHLIPSLDRRHTGGWRPARNHRTGQMGRRWEHLVALFLSTYVNKVDRKGRVSVPASFRAAVTGQSFAGIVTFRSFKTAAIEGSGIDRIEEMSARLDAL